jgi:hypothetical protein
VDSVEPAVLKAAEQLVGRFVAAERVSFADAARMVSAPTFPLVRLGLSWLKAKGDPTPADRPALRALLGARCRPLRPEILRRAAELLDRAGSRGETTLELLESRHADARAVGLSRLAADPDALDVDSWNRLLRSPDEDVQIGLIDRLDRLNLRSALDGSALKQLWRTLLLNDRRGSRAKPRVMAQVASRLSAKLDEAAGLLPLLAIPLRSSREPERRAALAAIAGLSERNPTLEEAIRDQFPELEWH